jgi:hypothetical protein
MTWPPTRTHVAFCPLGALDEDCGLTWAVGWFESLCELNGQKFTTRHRNAVAEAVERLHSPIDRAIRPPAGYRHPRCPGALHLCRAARSMPNATY